MRTIILSMALVVLIGGADGFAQGSSSVPKNSGASRRRRGDPGAGRPSPAARQRFAQREEFERPERSPSKENAALDRKIKSICRGC